MFRGCRLPLMVYYVDLPKLTRGKNAILENRRFDALKVIGGWYGHHGWIPG